MPVRPCLGCGRLTQGSRCNRPECRRGTTVERGYGASHEQAKRDPAYRDATHCVTCGEPFTTDSPKTAGHVVAVRHGGTATDGIIPQCRACNYGWRKTGH